jgi:hypothetical protein
MNRTIALLLTLAILLAHTLAIHKNDEDKIAPPYDQAHVAFRMANNFCENGSFAWDPGLPAGESYPSILWVGVATVFERLYLQVTSSCQLVGALSTMLAALILGRFSPGRLAGVIAPLLFVFAGGIAAAAASGMETAFFSLAIIASFLAFERRWPVRFAIALSVACATRSEGVLFAWTLLAIESASSLRGRDPTRPALWWSFVPPLLVTAAISGMRYFLLGHFLSPWTASLLEWDPQRWWRGFASLRDFVAGSGWTVLLFFPLWYLLRGSLRGLGRRAFLIASLWALVGAWAGGGHLPFSQSLVPMIPLLLIAIQEAMTQALDSKRRGMPAVTWVMFLVGLSSSALASKYPGNLGPLPLNGLHRWWMQPEVEPMFGYTEHRGRLGLDEELNVTERLRSIGIFMRFKVDPRFTVLTPWPGSIGYLSRLKVIDAFGRTTPPPGSDRVRPWTGSQRADVVSLLAQKPDYIVPAMMGDLAPKVQRIATIWTRYIDLHPEDVARSKRIGELLQDYEQITVPIPVGNSENPDAPRRPCYLMRRKDLGLAPRLSVSLEGRSFRVEVSHHSHEQLVDLRVEAVDAEGRSWYLRPNGEWVSGSKVLARCSIVLFETQPRRIELVRGELPEGIGATQLRAVLRNPGASDEHAFSMASEPCTTPIAPR